MNTDPHHVFKGHRMAGHMGHARCTVRNLEVVRIDSENDLLLVRGAVPGPNGVYLVIRQSNKLGGKRKRV
jgi:large subunit ribosomal protein L3